MKRFLVLFLLALFGCEAPMTRYELDMEERQRPATPVLVNEPQIGSWTNNPAWGSGYNGAMPLAAGAEVPVFSLDRTYGPPAVHAINLWSSANVGAANGDIRAKIRFGAGAVQNEFLCDWINGQQFALPLDHLRITAITFNPDLISGSYVATGGDIQLTATVARGGANNSAPLTYTEPFQRLANAAFTRFTIPTYAKAYLIQFTGNNDPTVPTNVIVSTIFPSTSIDYDAQVFAGGQSATFIPPGVTEIQVLNSTGADLDFSFQWILGI